MSRVYLILVWKKLFLNDESIDSFQINLGLKRAVLKRVVYNYNTVQKIILPLLTAVLSVSLKVWAWAPGAEACVSLYHKCDEERYVIKTSY